MSKTFFIENRSRLLTALIALLVLAALCLAAYTAEKTITRNNDHEVSAALATLTYTEDAAEAELASLEALCDKTPMSVPVKGQLYRSLAEVSYMVSGDMLYNRYVADALFYLCRAGDEDAVVYLTNKYIGRLYANGCYDSAEEVLTELAAECDISAQPLKEQAAYHLSLADVDQMLGKSADYELSAAADIIARMPQGGERDINQAKHDLLAARQEIESGNFGAAEKIMAAYAENDNFGFGEKQVYVVCDFQIPYYELTAKLSLHRQNDTKAAEYVKKYVAACAKYDFRAMELRLLRYMAEHSEAQPPAADVYTAMAQTATEQNLAEMTSKYGEFLLTDIDLITNTLTAQEVHQRRTQQLVQLCIAALCAALLIHCFATIFIDRLNRDGLTQLNNRRKFSKALADCARKKIPHCLLIFDIDDFKQVNDRYGHEQGDRVLRAIADILRRYTGRGINAYRYGGEELCLMLLRVPEDRTRSIAEEIRTEVERSAGGDTLRVTVSGGIGVSVAGENVFRPADEKLYAAKRSGKNKVL